MVTFAKEKTSVILEDVSWDFYTRTLHEIGHGATRIVYDEGRMEIMTTSMRREAIKTFIARLLEMWSVEKDVPVYGFGNVTLRREDLGQGLEPDECYYVSLDQPPLSDSGMDIVNYPPPDFAIEVEVSRGMLSKRAIYAALGVPEIWRWDGSSLRVLRLRESREYEEVAASICLPTVPLDAIAGYLRRAIEGENQHTLIKAWRDSLRA